jgi:hypothetical protein
VVNKVWLKVQATKEKLFVDTHESLPNHKYLKEQTSFYLKRERLKHRWYQMELKDFEVYVNEGCLIPEKGFRNKSQEGLEMVELHVDEIPYEIPDSELLTNINLRYPFVGNLSVQKSPEEKPLLSVYLSAIYFYFICLEWPKRRAGNYSKGLRKWHHDLHIPKPRIRVWFEAEPGRN